ncbi:uncharacterized protein JCM15063_000836 [Sporobolomyces koalae]|uniref:uncharacterized protein n=1 Tax=Sporobolomyces koalae TaxID=500713 RepID=UPI00317CBB6B
MVHSSRSSFPPLADLSPVGIGNFLNHLELIFATKGISEDRTRILALGLACSESPSRELASWWSNSTVDHLKKTWKEFLKESDHHDANSLDDDAEHACPRTRILVRSSLMLLIAKRSSSWLRKLPMPTGEVGQGREAAAA